MNETDNAAQEAFGPEDIIQAGSATATPAQEQAPAAEPAAPPAPESEKPKPKFDIRITDEDRTAYMRHVLGGLRFVKEYIMAKGALRIRLRSRTLAENDELYDALAAEVREGKLTTNVAGMEYIIRMFRFFLATSLIDISIDGVTLKPEGKTMLERHAWLSKQFNETQFRILLRAQEEFDYLMGVLYGEALDADFTSDRASAF